MMICDECIKSEVCKLKDRCKIFEDRIISPVLEGWVTVEIKCKHKEVRQWEVNTLKNEQRD